jgi:hypothetical protein
MKQLNHVIFILPGINVDEHCVTLYNISNGTGPCGPEPFFVLVSEWMERRTLNPNLNYFYLISIFRASLATLIPGKRLGSCYVVSILSIFTLLADKFPIFDF